MGETAEARVREGSEPSDAPRARRALVRARQLARTEWLALCVFGVFVVAGISFLIHPWSPVEDLAITELTVRHAGAHPPLTGAYSSLPFHHPGPLLFWYLWAPYELFGQRSSALLAANLWFNGAVLALIVSLARRLGGRWLPPVLAGAVFLWAIDSGLPRLLEPWNPYVGALPMLALALLAWAMAERKAWALPIAAGLATWVVQAHIQFAPTTLALCGVGVVALVVQVVRTDGRSALRDLRWPVAVAAALSLVLWAPVLLDVVLHGSASNPAAILRHYRGPQPPTVPRADVVNVIRSQLSLQPSWANGPRPYGYFLNGGAVLQPLAVPLWLLVLAAAAGRRAWTEVRGMVIALIGLASACFALTRISGPTFGRWYLIAVEAMSITVSALAVVSLLATVRWLIARRAEQPEQSELGDGREPKHRLADGAAAVVTLGFVIATAFSFHHLAGDQRSAGLAERMLPAVEAAIPEGKPVYLEGTYEFGNWIHGALVLQLDRAGYEVYAQSPIADKYPRPLNDPPPADAVRLVVVTDPLSTDWAPGVSVVTERRIPATRGDDKPHHVYVLEAPMGSPLTTDG